MPNTIPSFALLGYKRGHKYFNRMRAETGAITAGDETITIAASMAPDGFVGIFDLGFSVPLTIIDPASGDAIDVEAITASSSGANINIGLAWAADRSLPAGSIASCRLSEGVLNTHGCGDWSASASAKDWVYIDEFHPDVTLDYYGYGEYTFTPEVGQMNLVEIDPNSTPPLSRLRIALPQDVRGASSGPAMRPAPTYVMIVVKQSVSSPTGYVDIEPDAAYAKFKNQAGFFSYGGSYGTINSQNGRDEVLLLKLMPAGGIWTLEWVDLVY